MRGHGMDGTSPYRVVDSGAIGVDEITLEAFGAYLSDTYAAVIKVDGDTVVLVLAPASRGGWEERTEHQFRAAVRDAARAHHLFDRIGTVTILFDPTETQRTTNTGSLGEPVERV
jgi:hypothetical protein